MKGPDTAKTFIAGAYYVGMGDHGWECRQQREPNEDHVFFFFFKNSDLSGSCKLVHEPRLIYLAHS